MELMGSVMLLHVASGRAAGSMACRTGRGRSADTGFAVVS